MPWPVETICEVPVVEITESQSHSGATMKFTYGIGDLKENNLLLQHNICNSGFMLGCCWQLKNPLSFFSLQSWRLLQQASKP